SSVENLVPNPSESEGKYECDVPACEVFTTFSNILFDANYDFYSNDDQSFSDEDIPKKIYSNPLFDEDIISMKIDPHHFNAESNLIESLLNRDSSIISFSSKIDSLFDEFAGELTLLESIPPGINETDCDSEEETHFIKRLLYDNSSPRPPEEFVSENSDAAIESFSSSPIPVEDSDPLIEEIDLSLTPDDPMPPSIEEDDYDSERDILILEELLSNNSLPFPENVSFHFDIHSSSRPPTKPPDAYGTIDIHGEMVGQFIQKKKEEKQIEEEHAAKTRYWKNPACYDDDDDYTIAITHKEPDNSLSMGDEHLDTVLATESDEFKKSSVENLVPNPSESEEEKRIEEEQAIKAQSWKSPVCYDDDDDEESSNYLNDNSISELPSYSAVIPTEPIDSLSMGDEHLDTIPATKSDEFIKSCVENLVPNPSESKGESGCDVPAGFTTFSNVLFDDDYDSDSSDDQSLSDEDVRDKIYSNPFFDEEIIPMEIDHHSLNAESDLIESMPNHDSSVIISSRRLILFSMSSPRLLYDNSSPRPPEKIISDISNADIESFSPSPIPNEDSDSHMEEIDLFLNPNEPMLPGIKDDDDDSERDSTILEELLDNYSLSLATTESYHFDIPSPYRPPAKPPDGNTETLNIKMMGDVSDQKVPIPNLT
nr:hypothetical protein [Tanacetum cinerariifolium]